jgi:glycosyltransferase involved in cell wall biosynthesis
LSTPAVSVLMAVYNGEATVAAALESILGQTMVDWECVVVDDGSTDGSAAVVASFAAREPRVRLVRNAANIGLTASLIAGLGHCQGSYIARQDADDVSLPERLAWQRDLIEREQLDLVVGLAVTSEGRVIPSRLHRVFNQAGTLLLGNYLVHGTYFARRELFHEISYVPHFRLAQDYRFLLECLQRGKRVGVLARPVYRLNTRGARLSIHSADKQRSFARLAHTELGLPTPSCFEALNSPGAGIAARVCKVVYVLKNLVANPLPGRITYHA